MTKILVLRNRRVFKGLFIHLIGCEHDQDLGLPFSHAFKQVGHWSTYLDKTPNYSSGTESSDDTQNMETRAHIHKSRSALKSQASVRILTLSLDLWLSHLVCIFYI